MKNAQQNKNAGTRSVQTGENKVLPHLSLYVNGKYLEINVHCQPFMKSAVVMIPVKAVALELGYHLEQNNTDGFATVTKTDYFDENIVTIRYIGAGKDASVSEYYYEQGGQYLNIPHAPELQDDDLFVPVEFFTKALKCSVNVSQTGNINIRQ